jgi:hypothetical protein
MRKIGVTSIFLLELSAADAREKNADPLPFQGIDALLSVYIEEKWHELGSRHIAAGRTN